MGVKRAFPRLSFRRLTNLVQANDGTDRMFVTEQPGVVRVFPNTQEAGTARVFLDISSRISERNNEEGLLGIAFDPNYGDNGYVYLYYSASSPRRSVLSRFVVSGDDPNKADPDSEFIILEIPQPFGNHNGGQLAFGPDGYLYVGLGDGGSGGDPRGNGQNVGTLLGSILRLDVTDVPPEVPYLVPADNPFVAAPGARGEIWAYGLRNPWRFSFDLQTGILWAADVGQDSSEEINVVERGLNYGWNVMEGLRCFRPRSGCDVGGLEPPVFEYDHSQGCSVTGGYVYRGLALPPLFGAYLFADFCSGRIWGLRHDGGAGILEHQLIADTNLSITSFGQDLAGNIYILSRDDGIYALSPRD